MDIYVRHEGIGIVGKLITDNTDCTANATEMRNWFEIIGKTLFATQFPSVEVGLFGLASGQ